MRVLLIWEIGGGRGHVVHLGAIAAALQRRGCTNSAYLVHLDHAPEIAPYCDSVRRCARLERRDASPASRPSTRYGDWLGRHHFDDPAALRAAIKRWREIIGSERPDIVVADQSPTAILAARSLSIPVAHVGVPATTPPWEMDSYPPYPGDDGPPGYDEVVLCAAISEAVDSYGLPPLHALPAVYRAEDEIVASVDLLDRYDPWRKHARVPPVIGGWQEPETRLRNEVFIYLSSRDRHEPTILAAVATLDLPTRVVIAGNPIPSVTVARWRNAIVEEQPLPPVEIIRRARVLVHGGNHGISCLGIRAGLPQVTLSELHEHVFDGQRIAAAGAGIIVERHQWTVPALHKAINEAWADSTKAARAEELAAALAPQFDGDPGEMTADRIEAIMR